MSNLFTDRSLDLATFVQEYGGLFRKAETAMLGDRAGSAEVRVLLALLSGSREMRDLRVSLEMDSGQLSRLCSSLERKRLLTVSREGRRSALILTEQGALEAEERHARQTQSADAFYRGMSEWERERLGASLKILAENLPDIDYQIDVRRAEPGDTGGIVEATVKLLSSGEYGHDGSQVANRWHRYFAEMGPDTMVLVAANRRHLAGGICISVDRSARSGHIDLLCLFHYYFWGRGFGSQLLEAGVALSKERRLSKLTANFPRYAPVGYLSLQPGWKKLSVQEALLWGRSVPLETWELSL